MENFLLGIDIGTSSCKVAIFNTNGKVISSANGNYDILYGESGFVEQNPNDWWETICSAIKKVLEISKINSKNIIGVGVDGQSWSSIPIDKDGHLLANTPIWLDTRSANICEELNKNIGSDKIFQLAGNLLQPTYSTAKILWYKKNMSDMYSKIDKILQSNSFIVYKLTGNYSQDLSQGYGLHCFNMKKGTWDETMAKELGIPTKFLPEIYRCHDIVGKISKQASKLTGLFEGTPVVAGGLDAACGALGAGVINKGQTQEQGGQAGGMSICMDEYKADERLILGYHVVPNRFLLQGGTTGGGGVMRWFEKEFGDFERIEATKNGTNSFEIFNKLAQTINAGSDGLIFLPYMAGERSPIWNHNAKGVFFGLDFEKTKGHMIRSMMEGVAFSLKHNLDVAKEIGVDVSVLMAVGGAANSSVWTQIKSDVCSKEIIVPDSDMATTLGAALLAGVGVGVYKDFEDAVKVVLEKKKYIPNFNNSEIYQKNYETYLELYKNLELLMNSK